MKRIGNIFDEIISIDNLRLAHFEAKSSRKPRRRKGAERFELNLEENLKRLHDELANETWMMHPYRCMVRVERGKEREIFYSPEHEDSVVQHAILRTLGRRLEKTFVRDVFASIPGRGTHDGVMRVKRFLQSVPRDVPCYIGKYDIRKFYKSINHDALKWSVSAKIKDVKVVRLIERIIDSHADGIPIGNSISPMLANLHLSKLDHAAKEIFRISGYFRYLDDIVAIEFGADAKRKLKTFAEYLKKHLAWLNLELKPNGQIFPIERHGLDFLGYVFTRSKIRVRKKTERRFRRAVRNFKSKPTVRNRMTLSSYWGIIKWISKPEQFWFTFFNNHLTELEVSL